MANGICHELLHESPHLAGVRTQVCFLQHLAHHPGRSGLTESCPVGHHSDSDVMGTRAGGVFQGQVISAALAYFEIVIVCTFQP